MKSLFILIALFISTQSAIAASPCDDIDYLFAHPGIGREVVKAFLKKEFSDFDTIIASFEYAGAGLDYYQNVILKEKRELWYHIAGTNSQMGFAGTAILNPKTCEVTYGGTTTGNLKNEPPWNKEI